MSPVYECGVIYFMKPIFTYSMLVLYSKMISMVIQSKFTENEMIGHTSGHKYFDFLTIRSVRNPTGLDSVIDSIYFI